MREQTNDDSAGKEVTGMRRNRIEEFCLFLSFLLFGSVYRIVHCRYCRRPLTTDDTHCRLHLAFSGTLAVSSVAASSNASMKGTSKARF